MGLFKDIKKMKEFSEDRGGMSNLKDARRDVRMVFDDRGEREILQTGISAMGIVKGILSQVPQDRLAMQVPIEVHPPNGEPYVINYVFPAPRIQAGLTPGQEVPIKISKDDPSRIAIQWEAQKAAIAADGGAVASAMKSLANVDPQALQASFTQALGGVEMPAWMNPSQQAAGAAGGAGAAPGRDIASRLKQLDELKARALITDEEYNAKRLEILSDV